MATFISMIKFTQQGIKGIGGVNQGGWQEDGREGHRHLLDFGRPRRRANL